MLSLLKRYYELLAVAAMLLVPFAMFLTVGSRGREPIFLDRAIVSVTTPLQSGLSAVVDGTVSVWKGYAWLRGLRQENESLKKQNGELLQQVHALDEARAENDRLRRMLGYAESAGGAPVVARVVGVNPDAENPSLRVNRGESDGIQRGMAVVTPDGVVGQVQRTTGHASDVLLLIDPKSRVGVRDQRSRARGVAGVSGTDRVLHLDYGLKTDSFEDGDVLVTSGTDGIYPPGLVVGRLSRIDRKQRGPFISAEIQAAVDVSNLEEVFLLPTTIGGAAGLLNLQVATGVTDAGAPQ